MTAPRIAVPHGATLGMDPSTHAVAGHVHKMPVETASPLVLHVATGVAKCCEFIHGSVLVRVYLCICDR